jgi:hypothetical protein
MPPLRGHHQLSAITLLLIVYGSIVLMSLMISATFLWLWFEHTTPLALGMAYSWAGIGLVTGWWWLYDLGDRPLWAAAHPGIFVLLALTMVGAVLHFAVIHSSFGRRGPGFLWPVAAALALSALIFFTF